MTMTIEQPGIPGDELPATPAFPPGQRAVIRRRLAPGVLLAAVAPWRAARRIAQLERMLDASIEAHVITMARHYEREHPGESPWTRGRA